ncbi:MAG: hypothetical protein WKI04_11140 [Ferruginibacter sp.]
MKIFIYIIPLYFYRAEAQELQVMTFNIRYNNPSDSMNAWPFRKDNLASTIFSRGSFIRRTGGTA